MCPFMMGILRENNNAQIESVDNTSWDNHVSHNMWHYIIVRPNTCGIIVIVRPD
jgi:hypothetical protein